MEEALKVSVDRLANCAYVSLRDVDVVRTEQINDTVNADLDAEGHVVGIEILALGALVPMNEIAQKFHLTSVETEKFQLALANL